MGFRFFRFIRRHVRPIEPNRALKWHNRLRNMYLFFAWNALGGLIFYYGFGSGSKREPKFDGSAESWVKLLKIPNTVTIVKVKGLGEVESYKYKIPLEGDDTNEVPREDQEMLNE